MNPKRIFIDTNLFLRFLTDDVPTQADAVESLLQRAAAGELLLATNSMVIAELVWTLESFYKLDPSTVEEKVMAILSTPGLEIEDSERLFQALAWYVEKNVDFIDAYNVAWMQGRGIKQVFTFDRRHYGRFEEIDLLSLRQM